MGVPKYADEALVILSTLDRNDASPFPYRRILLSKHAPTVQIGRTSKRKASLEAKMENAFFDCPVMSRNHALLKMDPDKQQVYLSDDGSLHGTMLNKRPVAKNVVLSINTKDVITFGIPIDRGNEVFSPYEVEVQVIFGEEDPSKRPVVYRVPDDSDVEDASSDESGGIEHSLEILRESCRPMSTQPPIDLTEDDFTVNIVEANLNAQEVSEHSEDASPQTHASPRANTMSEEPFYPPLADEDIEALEADFAAERQSDAENEAPYDPAAAMDGYQELIAQHDIDRNMAEVCRGPLVWASEASRGPSQDPSQSEEVATVPPADLLLNISSTEHQPPVVIQKLPSLREVDGTVSENIGEKYGKEDFFAAMKQNRKTVVPQQPANLEESGRKFLQTPPEDLAEPEISRGPVLDDSSAYQFEMSKKAISKQNSMKRTRMDIKDLVEPSSIEHGAIAHTPRSVKRKAEDISQTTAEEETFTSATGFKHARAKTETAPLPTNQSISCTQSPRGALQAKMSTDLPRPHKKIRRAAEVFGYAALGGLAVMSALIATAPAL